MFYIYEFYNGNDKDEYLIDELSDETLAAIAEENTYDYVKCYENRGMGCKGKKLFEKEL